MEQSIEHEEQSLVGNQKKMKLVSFFSNLIYRLSFNKNNVLLQYVILMEKIVSLFLRVLVINVFQF